MSVSRKGRRPPDLLPLGFCVSSGLAEPPAPTGYAPETGMDRTTFLLTLSVALACGILLQGPPTLSAILPTARPGPGTAVQRLQEAMVRKQDHTELRIADDTV